MPEDQDLYFISNDGDFQSPYKKRNFHPFLGKEWAKNRGSTLHFFATLTEAFDPLSLEIHLSEYLDRQDALRELSSSSNFRDTHIAIARLAEFDSGFDDAQLNSVFDAIVSNNQVGWIFWDGDIQDFFWQLVDGRLNEIYRETLDVFQPWLRENLNTMDRHEINPAALQHCQDILDLDPSQARLSPEDDIPF